MTAHPPRPVLSLVVGITGHRPNGAQGRDGAAEGIRDLDPDRLQDVLAAQLAEISGHLATFTQEQTAAFAAGPARLTLVSCLAEGADRAAARAALEAGWSLSAILPFAIDDYCRDFRSEASLQEFMSLLTASGRTRPDPAAPDGLILPGTRAEAGKAYELAGHVLLDHVSILIAVWDGAAGNGRGGTEEIVAEAVRRQIPVIRIDATRPDAAPRLHWSRLETPPVQSRHFQDLPAEDAAGVLKAVLGKILLPPEADAGSLAGFNRETEPRWNLRPDWPLLQALFFVRRPGRQDLRPTPVETLQTDLQRLVRSEPGGLLPAHGWADALGVCYGQMFRSAFVANFVLAGLAVFVVALSIFFKDALHVVDRKWPFVLVELVLISLVLANTYIGKWRGWHRRWMEYRDAAERLRVSAGLRRIGTRLITAGGEAPAWPFWYARAISRAAGVPHADLGEATLSDRREDLCRLLLDQAEYHKKVQARFHTLEHRMERAGEVLFVFILLLAAAYLGCVAFGFKPGDALKYTVTALTAGVPVLATAIYGIRVIGDLEGISRRSKRMSEELAGLIKALRADAGNPKRKTDLVLLQSRGHQAADIMLGDLDSWRTSAQSRGLQIPG